MGSKFWIARNLILDFLKELGKPRIEFQLATKFPQKLVVQPRALASPHVIEQVI